MADYLDMINCQIGKGMVDKNGNIWPYSTTFKMDEYKAMVRERCKFGEDWMVRE